MQNNLMPDTIRHMMYTFRHKSFVFFLVY